MPIALMIHGSGYMTLSCKAICPAQTSFLLSNSIFPISIDHHLCPKINLIDRAITNICDAFTWTSTILPGLLESKDVNVDLERIVAISWSTGGHLAMTMSWTTAATRLNPPCAILSFYRPTDFKSGELDEFRLKDLPKHTMPLLKIIDSLPLKPVTGHHAPAGHDCTGLGIIQPGTPCFKLVLSLFTKSESVGLSLLLNRHPRTTLARCATATPSDDDIKALLERPSAESVAVISPLAQVWWGAYTTPTYVIHSTGDEIVAFSTAERFVATLRGRGIQCGLLALKGLKHIHDLKLRPGMSEWEEQVEPGYQFLFEALK